METRKITADEQAQIDAFEKRGVTKCFAADVCGETTATIPAKDLEALWAHQEARLRQAVTRRGGMAARIARDLKRPRVVR